MTQKIRILYVDDEPDLLEIGGLFLEESGDFMVATALSAPEALRLLEQEKFDGIISDYQMPGMDGIQFLVEVRTRFGPIPFILFTGRGREEVVIRALNSGADFYLQKGGEPEAQFAELSHKVKKAVEARQAEEDVRVSHDQLTRSEADLQSHQIELETQAKELMRAKLMLEESRDKFLDLYEFAPLGYLTLSDKGLIIEVNITGATLLGVERTKLLKARFSTFIAETDSDEWYRFFRDVLKQDKKKTGTLMLKRSDGSMFPARLECIRISGSSDRALMIRVAVSDISDIRLAEDALRESERRTRLHEERLIMAQEIGRTGSWEYNLETNEIWGSADGLHLFGFPRISGVFSINDIESCIPERERVHQALVDLISLGKEYNLEYAINPADGSAPKIIHSFARLEKDTRGNPLRVMGVIQDITERKKVENEIQFKNAILSTQQETSLDAILIVDENGKIINYNQKFIGIWGIPDELIASRMDELVLQFVVGQLADPEAFLSRVRYLYEHKNEKSFEELLLKDRRILERFSAPMFGEQGKYYGRVWYFRDVTERKEAENVLQFTRHSIDSAIETMVTITRDGHFADVNDSFCRKSGYLRDELLSMTVQDIDPDYSTENWSAYWNKLQQSGSLTFESTHHTKEGKTYPVEITSTYFEYGGKEYQCAFARDITDRKRVKEALKESEQNLKESQAIAQLGRWELDLVYNTLHWSDGIYQIFEINPAEFGATYEAFLACIHPDDRDAVNTAYTDSLKTKKPYEIVHRLLMNDGRIKWVNEICRTEYDSKGQPLRSVGIVLDITKIKKVDEVLRESEERYRAISDTTTDFVFSCVKPEGGTYSIDWMAGAVERITGYTIDELLAMGCWKCLVLPEDAPVFDENITNLLPGTSRSCRLRIRTKSGSERWLTVNTTHVPTKGSPSSSHVFGGCRDITESKKAEEQALSAHEEWERTFNAVPDLISIIDTHHTILRVNRAMAEKLGMTPEQAIGLTCYQHVHGTQCPPDFCPHAQLVQDGEEHTSEVYEKQFGGHFLVSCTPLRDDAGRLTGSVHIARDINERKAAEEALRESRERLELALRGADEGIIDWDLSRGTLTANEATAGMLGYSLPEFPKTSSEFISLIHPDDRREGDLRFSQLLSGKIPVFDHEERFRTVTGEWKWILARGKIVERDERGNALRYIGTQMDITKRRKAEDALRQANRKLSLLFSITRHDINNQLTVLRGYLNRIAKKHPDPSFNSFLDKSISAAERISTMIHFTRDYEEIGIRAPVWQEISTLVDTTAKDVVFEKIQIINDVPAGAEVFADPLVVKVFYNLMDNAVRYGGKITTIRFFLQESGDDHLIVCEDNGEGIPGADKKKIFDPGFGKNTGLGLALSREILAITGITIRENGEPGTGSRFEMSVPEGAYRCRD